MFINTTLLLSTGFMLTYSHLMTELGSIYLLLRSRFRSGVGYSVPLGAAIRVLSIANVLNTSAGGYQIFVLAGMHGSHLVVGILLVFSFVDLSSIYHASASIKVSAIYWHLVDSIWLLLLTALYDSHTTQLLDLL